jgi:hypothetical protein
MVNRRGAPQNMRPAEKGEVRNPRGRPPGQRPHAVILWDLKQQMRALCPKARDVVERCLNSEDERVALLAAQIAFERGYGKPEQHADINVTRNFAEVPQVMGQAEWLARRGQPEGPAGDEWLQRQLAKPEPEPEKRASGPPTGAAGHSSEQVLDLTAEDPLLTAVDPTEPPPPGRKLN